VWAIYGEEDALYRGKLDALRAALAQAADFRGLALVEGAGHWLQFERAEAFDKALLTALEAAL
jgi:pimeloyl-ACP methyl ester carboxylesterase